jgi:glycosyltransferase involved in cell wall biosynthesis
LTLFKKEHFFQLNEGITLLEPNGFNISELSLYKTIQWIRAIAKNTKPNNILVFNKLYGAITGLALLGMNQSYFLSERSSPFFKWKFPFNIINRMAYTINPPKGVIAQTNIAAQYQKKYFKKSKVEVIPNSVRDVQLFPEIKRESVILAVGRLNDHLKGFDLLLASMALLKNQDWELHIAGGDDNGETLKKQSEQLGIRNRVKFLGQVKEIDKCYASAGIYVIPSRSEGFPNSLAEAMAAGCCCIAFDFLAGPSDMIINDYNGLLVPPNDIKQMAAKIDELIMDKIARENLEKNALAIREKLSLNIIIQQIHQFIR